MGAMIFAGARVVPGIVPAPATGAGLATEVDQATAGVLATAAGQAWRIAAGRARVTVVVVLAATTPSRAWAAARPRSMISIAVAPAISRWRPTAARRAPARVHGQAEAPARALGRAAAGQAQGQVAVGRREAVVVVAAAGAKVDSTMRSTARYIRGATITSLAALVAALALFMAWIPAALAQQKTFASPEAAMNAFPNAVATSDEDALKSIFGADFWMFSPLVGAEGRYRFLAAWSKSHAIKPEGDAKALVAVGDDGWTLPIPIVKTAGGWRFPTRAGADEMRIRRIGRNERAVMQVMLAIYDAQREYATRDRTGDGVLEYAAKFRSAPGKKDGLDLGQQAKRGRKPARACRCYGPRGGKRRRRGGHDADEYKILTSQGKNAPGRRVRLRRPWPDDRRVCRRQLGRPSTGIPGVMTFIVKSRRRGVPEGPGWWHRRARGAQ